MYRIELCQVEGIHLPIPGAEIESPIDNCWRGVDTITRRIAPKRFARSRIERIEPVVLRANVDHPTGDRWGGVDGIFRKYGPDAFASRSIKGKKSAIR